MQCLSVLVNLQIIGSASFGDSIDDIIPWRRYWYQLLLSTKKVRLK